VRLAALTEAPYAFGSTWERERHNTAEQWRHAIEGRARFVAELEGRVVGMSAAGASDDVRAAALTSVWVAPQARGHGVGDSLVLAATAWASAKGYGQIVLWVTDGNHRAEKLYERHGFRRTGSVQQVRAGEEGVEYEMSLTLG
jgi:ribosomal protein S18 acetylase RimI-like enzyme